MTMYHRSSDVSDQILGMAGDGKSRLCVVRDVLHAAPSMRRDIVISTPSCHSCSVTSTFLWRGKFALFLGDVSFGFWGRSVWVFRVDVDVSFGFGDIWFGCWEQFVFEVGQGCSLGCSLGAWRFGENGWERLVFQNG